MLASCEVVADLLDARDQLAIVTFSTHAGVRCGLTTVDPAGRAQLAASLRGITADGSTNLHNGLEVAAGVLAVARPGLRRVLVLMSDGQPNVGLSSAAQLAAFTRSLGLAVSTLGFGLHHDEVVLDAIALAGSGRYAYVPDPMLARVDLARAALAHGGIVAAQLELEIALGDGCELVEISPARPLRHRKGGVTCAIGDVFVDEGRLLALRLRLDLDARLDAKLGAKLARGELARVTVSGVGADGTPHRVTVPLEIDIHAGPHALDRDAQRDIVLVEVEGARAHVRGIRSAPEAAVVLRKAIARIDALAGFVRNDGSPLAELREQIEDEAITYESAISAQERGHRDKAARSARVTIAPQARTPPPPGPAAYLLAAGGPLAGQRIRMLGDMSLGRGSSNDVVIPSSALSRCHTRIVYANGGYVLQDLGSTNGSIVNRNQVTTHVLADGDRIVLGDQELIVSFDK